jgi:hypothetical protein
MRIESAHNPTRSHVLELPPSRPGTVESDNSRCKLPARSWNPPAVHDATLLVAALEDLEAKRIAIEWLLDADLLCLCLV